MAGLLDITLVRLPPPEFAGKLRVTRVPIILPLINTIG
jgi:hypothetical protein